MHYVAVPIVCTILLKTEIENSHQLVRYITNFMIFIWLAHKYAKTGRRCLLNFANFSHLAIYKKSSGNADLGLSVCYLFGCGCQLCSQFVLVF